MRARYVVGSGTPSNFNLSVGNTPFYPYKIAIPNDGQWSQLFEGIATSGGSSIAIHIGEITSNDTAAFEIQFIYIGTGAYTSLVSDRSGRGNNLTNVAVTPVNGKYGRELSFNGKTSYLQASSPVIGATGTIAVRFKMNQLNKAQYLVTNSSNTYGFRLYTESNNVINLFIGGDSGYDNYNIGMVSDTTYYHTIIVTVNGLNATVHRDGVTTSITLTHTLSAGLVNLMFGYYTDVPSLAFNGIISHFRYDNRVWNADEAMQWYLNPTSPDSRV